VFLQTVLACETLVKVKILDPLSACRGKSAEAACEAQVSGTAKSFKGVCKKDTSVSVIFAILHLLCYMND
jgi:hypothetical protein